MIHVCSSGRGVSQHIVIRRVENTHRSLDDPGERKAKEESFHSPSSYLITPRQSLPFASQDPTTAGMNQWLTLYKCMQPCKHVLFPPTNQFHMCSRRTLHLGSLLYLSLKDTFLKKTQGLQSERCILIYWYVLKMHI